MEEINWEDDDDDTIEIIDENGDDEDAEALIKWESDIDNVTVSELSIEFKKVLLLENV